MAQPDEKATTTHGRLGGRRLLAVLAASIHRER